MSLRKSSVFSTSEKSQVRAEGKFDRLKEKIQQKIITIKNDRKKNVENSRESNERTSLESFRFSVDSDNIPIEVEIENTLDSFYYATYSKEIAASLLETLYMIVGKATIELLTINFNLIMKNQMRKNLLKNIKEYIITANLGFDAQSASPLIKTKVSIIEKIIKKQMLSQTDVNCLVGRAHIDLIRNEFIELRAALLIESAEFSQMFLDDSKKTKNKLNLMALNTESTDFVQFNRTSTTTIVPNSPAAPSGERGGEWRMFGKCFLFKFYFPSLVYKSDLVKPSKNKFVRAVLKEESVINKGIKSLTGLFFALALTFFFYSYFRYELRIEVVTATYLTLALFVSLALGLCGQNPKIRCIILLVLPFMASSRGRAFLLMTIAMNSSNYVLANVLRNVRSLSDSLICHKKLLQARAEENAKASDAYKWSHEKLERLREIRDSVEEKIDDSKEAVQKSAALIRKALHGVKQMANICQTNEGNGQATCINSMSNTFNYETNSTVKKEEVSQAHSNLLSFFNLCKKETSSLSSPCDSVAQLFSNLNTDFMERSEEFVRLKFDRFKRQFQFETTASKTGVETTFNNTSSELMNASRDILSKYYDWFELVNSTLYRIKFMYLASLALVVAGAYWYLSKYMKRDYYKNYVLGPKFYELDEKRRARGEASVLPLNDYLRDKFAGLFDYYLTKKETDLTLKALLAMSMALTPIYLCMLLDCWLSKSALYIRDNGKFEIEIDNPPTPPSELLNVKVNGSGFLPDTYKEIFASLDDEEPPDPSSNFFSNAKCLPRVYAINKQIYTRINAYTTVLVLLTLFQAYIKRLRSVFAGSVYPDRDLERSVWLYNHILTFNTNMGFIKRKSSTDSEAKPPSTLKVCVKGLAAFFYELVNYIYGLVMFFSFYYLFTLVPSKSLKSIYLDVKAFFLLLLMKLKMRKKEFCSNCTILADRNDPGFVKCSNESCTSVYCEECFGCLRNQCKVCKFDIVQDSDDESGLEKDSSDDEDPMLTSRKSSSASSSSSDAANSKLSVHSNPISLVIQIENEPIGSYFGKSRVYKNKFRFLAKDLDLNYQKAKKSWETYIEEFNEERRKSAEMNEIKTVDSDENAHSWSRFDVVLISYDLERAKKLISSSFREFYIKIEHLIDHNLFKSILTTSLEIRRVFEVENETYNVFDGLSMFVAKNYVEKTSLKDYFDMNELDKQSFYEYLKNHDFQ